MTPPLPLAVTLRVCHCAAPLRRVTFGEALGLLALCRILVGGFGKGGGTHGHSGGDRRSRGDGRPWWKKPKTIGESQTPSGPRTEESTN